MVAMIYALKDSINNSVKITSFNSTITKSAFVLSCSTALTLNDWLTESSIKNLIHTGIINCRRMKQKNVQSAHSYGTAIDKSIVDGASVRLA